LKPTDIAVACVLSLRIFVAGEPASEISERDCGLGLRARKIAFPWKVANAVEETGSRGRGDRFETSRFAQTARPTAKIRRSSI
jgi:hypothetical protein